VVIEADALVLEDCECDYLAPSINREVVLTRTRARILELDKIISRAVMTDCETGEEFTGATGVTKLEVRRGRFIGDIRPAGFEMDFEGCMFVGSAERQFGIWRHIDGRAVRSLGFRDCAFDTTDSPNLLHAINPGPDLSNVNLLPQIEVLEVVGDDVAVRHVGRWAPDQDRIWGNMAEGQPLWTLEGEHVGTVIGLHSDGRAVVRAAWTRRPQIGDVLKTLLIFGRFDGGGNKVIGRGVPLWRGKFESVEGQRPPQQVILDD
jgi:hypothetical protein